MLYAGILALLLVVLVIALYGFSAYEKIAEDRHELVATRARLNELLSSLKDAETGCRGYMLTGDSAFLKPYEKASEEAPRLLFSLEEYLIDTLGQRQASTLRDLSMRVLLQNREMILLTTDSVLGSATGNRDRLWREKMVMDRLRTVHDEVDTELLQQRAAMEEEETRLGWITPMVLALYAALAILATALMLRWLFRALSRTEKAKRETQLKVVELDREVRTRELAERALRRVLDSSISGIMAFHAVRNGRGELKDFEWTLVNDRAMDLLGRSSADLIGHHMTAVLPTTRENGILDQCRGLVENGEPLHFESHYSGDGIDRWLEITAVRLLDGLVMTITDITEQKRRDQLADETQRLALTGRIARTIAHEVRNPLTNLQLAQDQLTAMAAVPEDAAPYWDIMRRNTGRIGQLISEMLASSKKEVLKLEPVSIEELLRDTAREFQDRLELAQVELAWDLADDLPLVMVDRGKMKLALLNLCLNAIEAMTAGAGLLRLSATVEGGAPVLRIEDNGRGIASEDIDKLFDSFHTGRPDGMGLGLTTARSILNGHRVLVEVVSVRGTGTTFILRFPAELPDPGPA